MFRLCILEVISFIAAAVSVILDASSLPMSNSATDCVLIVTTSARILLSVALKYWARAPTSSFEWMSIVLVRSPSPSLVSLSVFVTNTMGLVILLAMKKIMAAVTKIEMTAMMMVSRVISLTASRTVVCGTEISTVQNSSPILNGKL